MGQRLFAVADVFRLATLPGTVIVVADCPPREVTPVRVGQRLEFRHTVEGIALVVAGIELADPPNPDRPFAFLVRPDSAAVAVGAEVWSLASSSDAEPGATEAIASPRPVPQEPRALTSTEQPAD